MNTNNLPYVFYISKESYQKKYIKKYNVYAHYTELFDGIYIIIDINNIFIRENNQNNIWYTFLLKEIFEKRYINPIYTEGEITNMLEFNPNIYEIQPNTGFDITKMNDNYYDNTGDYIYTCKKYYTENAIQLSKMVYELLGLLNIKKFVLHSSLYYLFHKMEKNLFYSVDPDAIEDNASTDNSKTSDSMMSDVNNELYS